MTPLSFFSGCLVGMSETPNTVLNTMTTLRRFLIIMSISPLFVAGCTKNSAPQTRVSPDAPILKVAVFSDGRLTVDGNSSTIESLREALRSLSEKHGAVWYYREAGQKQPPPIAMEALKAVTELRLPIRLSSRPDYSDAIGFDGKPIKQ